MARPGVNIIVRDAPPSRGVPTDTGVWFVTGLTDRGSTSQAIQVQSLTDYTTKCGPRVSYGILYDALDTFFREGGASAYIGRVVGPAAVAAKVDLNDSASAACLRVTAKSVGDWGNNLKCQVVAGSAGGSFVLVISESNVEVERSPDLLDQAAAITWSTASSYVTVTALASALDPAVVAATSLTGGTDDRASVIESHWTSALGVFTRSLGPGQVSAPGRTTQASGSALLAHAQANNRVALLDLPDTATVGTLTSAAALLRADGNADYGAAFGPWVQVPGIVPGTTRTVPYSAVQAGLESRRDQIGNANIAAAGGEWPLVFVVSLNVTFSDADRETLLRAGLNTAKSVYGTLETYGYRTLVDPLTKPNAVQFNHSRLRMAISAQGEAIGENFVFDQIDGRGLKAGEFGNAITGMLLEYYNAGALYGETPDQAFRVDVGPAVNTTVTIAAGELHAAASVRMSPHAEAVYIEFIKTPITQSV